MDVLENSFSCLPNQLQSSCLIFAHSIRLYQRNTQNLLYTNQSGDPALAETEAQEVPPEYDEDLPSCESK